jgi:hypothetical protein
MLLQYTTPLLTIPQSKHKMEHRIRLQVHEKKNLRREEASPVKMMAGFDDAFNSLEGQVWKPEKIGCSRMVGAVSPDAADAGQFVFQPP